jgi:hypothetical protein
MCVSRLVKLMVATVGLGLVLGAGVGAVIGMISPSFVEYELAMGAGTGSIQDGIALGLANGALYGLIAGSVLVVSVAIVDRVRESR